jgi:hypothetical protein
MNTYRAVGPAAVAAYGEGIIELELTASEEADVLASKLELVPRTYRALSDNYQVAQGQTFVAVYLVEVEAALISGGHIERVDDTPVVKSSKPKES